MNIFELIQYRPGFKKQSARTWEGPCPKCGGTKRFIVWIHQDIFKCRECDFKGDAVTFLRDVDGMGCAEAHLELGKQCVSYDCPGHGKCAATRSGGHAPCSDKQRRLATPISQNSKTQNWQPLTAVSPAEKWQSKACALVDKAHETLLSTPDQIAYLAGRGIPRAAIEKTRLGWIDADLYRDRESWGLDQQLRADGKKKKLWLPRGLLIPAFTSGGLIFRLRIRLTNEKLAEMRKQTPGKEPPRYYWVPGSGDDTWVLNPSARAYVVVESDLDGILIDWHAGDLVGTIPLGTCSARPRESVARLLDDAVCILNALDYEPRTNTATGRAENPGGENWLRWWRPRYPQAKRHPAPGGKDPGEAFQAGTDIRSWVIAGLPAGLRPVVTASQETVPSKTEIFTPETETSPPTIENPDVRQVRFGDRIIHLTNARPSYVRVRDAGGIVFSGKELDILRSGGYGRKALGLILDAKEIFGGHISAVGPL